jgi:electron transfer flavoprotein beta subunit
MKALPKCNAWSSPDWRYDSRKGKGENIMPNIVVCYKWVLDEQDIRVNAADRSLDYSRAKYKISEYDRNAIEEAVLLAEKVAGGKIGAVTFGSAAKGSLKDALSRGLDEVAWIGDAAADTADGFVTANVLSAMLKKIGDYDLILCGEGSADVYSQQVGPRIAALLGIPAITYVREMHVEGNEVVAVRKLGSCTETVRVPFPAVVTVLPEINKPRIPGLKQVLAAAKKPQREMKLADLELAPAALTPRTQIKAIRGYVMNRKNVICDGGSAADKVAKLVEALTKEGVLA